MIIASFDLSLTATGYAVAVDGVVDPYYGVITGKGDGIGRLVAMRNDVMAQVDAVKPDFVVMEGLSMASRGMNDQLAGNAYLIRAELFTDGIPYVLVSAMGLKKFVCGTAGSKKFKVGKELMLKEIFRRFGHDVTDNNVADAIGLAYVGMALCGDWQPQIEPQREVLASIRKSKDQKLPGFLTPRL